MPQAPDHITVDLSAIDDFTESINRLTETFDDLVAKTAAAATVFEQVREDNRISDAEDTARAKDLYKMIFREDVMILDCRRDIYMRLPNMETRSRPHGDSLWVASLASDAKTRELQVWATHWGFKEDPRPANKAKPLLVEMPIGMSVNEFLDEYTL